LRQGSPLRGVRRRRDAVGFRGPRPACDGSRPGHRVEPRRQALVQVALGLGRERLQLRASELGRCSAGSWFEKLRAATTTTATWRTAPPTPPRSSPPSTAQDRLRCRGRRVQPETTRTARGSAPRPYRRRPARARRRLRGRASPAPSRIGSCATTPAPSGVYAPPGIVSSGSYHRPGAARRVHDVLQRCRRSYRARRAMAAVELRGGHASAVRGVPSR